MYESVKESEWRLVNECFILVFFVVVFFCTKGRLLGVSAAHWFDGVSTHCVEKKKLFMRVLTCSSMLSNV